MSVQEIIYTSAQKGLKPGSSGFCTVVCTAGMDQRTASRLEGLSGYRHPFEINDPRNPINFQHITMRIGAANTHVLSRVSDAGPDHTGRTNKLAHHIAFTQPPSPSGPARLLNIPGLFATEWDGKTSQRAAPTLPSIPLADVKLSAWATLAKDGGWAGHIVEQLISNKQPVYVLFSAGTDTFSLLQEILDVVPANRRWQVTFSTYYTNPIAGAECQLRFVLDGTKDATKLRNDARAVVVDLTTPLAQATGGELVTLARSGMVTQVVAVPKQKPEPKADSSTSVSSKSGKSNDGDWIEPEADNLGSALASGASSAPDLATASKRPPAPNLFGAARAQKEQRLSAAGQRSSKGKIVGLVCGVVVLLVAVSAGVWVAVSDSEGDLKNTQLLEDSTKAREETERQEKRKADEALAEKEREQLAREEQKRADEIAKKEKQDAIDADAAKLAKQQEDEKEAARVAELAKGENARSPKSVDIFGEPIAIGGVNTVPVVRVIEWEDTSSTRTKAGVDIKVHADADLEFKVLHHHRKYHVQQRNDDTEWAVMGGVNSLTKVATIRRPTSERLTLELEDVKDPIFRSVLQLTSGARCGFAIFQKPQHQPAIALADVIGTVTDESLTAKEILAVPELEGDFTQRVEIRDGKGKVIRRSNVKLDHPSVPSELSFKRKTFGKDNDRVVFYFANGPTGAEHRHKVTLLRNRSTKATELEYKLEFAKRAGLQVTPLEKFEDALPWLAEQLPRFRRNHTERDWEPITRKAEAWAESEYVRLKDKIKKIESGLVAIRNSQATIMFQTANQLGEAQQEELKTQARFLKEMEPQAAVLQLLSQMELQPNGPFQPTRDLQGRDELNTLMQGIRNQAQAAGKSRTELLDYKLHFSAYLTIEEVRLPDDDKLYRLRIPVFEFTGRNDANRLDWKKLAEPSGTAAPSSKTRGVKTNAQPVQAKTPKSTAQPK